MSARELKQLHKLLNKFRDVENPTSEVDRLGKNASYNTPLEKRLIDGIRQQVKWYAEDEMGFDFAA